MTSVYALRPFLKPPNVRARKPAREASAVARLTLFINGTAYSVQPIRTEPGSIRKAFRLRKFDGTEYDIEQRSDGFMCDCPDSIFRREGLDPAGCKHIRALVSCGLLDPQCDETACEVSDAPTALELPPGSRAQDKRMGSSESVAPPLPANGQPATLLEILEHEVLGFNAWGSAAGKFLADQLGRVAQLLRWSGATTAEEFEDRIETYERELRDRLYDRGYQDGVEAGRREASSDGYSPDRR